MGRFSGQSKCIWYTPLKYIEGAREVMGGIDLDPATDEEGQTRIWATRYYTIETNGLKHPWKGRVWLNPQHTPQEVFEGFVRKALEEVSVGNVEQMIFLTHTRGTFEEWFQDLLEGCQAFCLHRGPIEWDGGYKLTMESLGGVKLKQPLELQSSVKAEYDSHGSVFFYFGPFAGRFVEVFGKWGFCGVRSPVFWANLAG